MQTSFHQQTEANGNTSETAIKALAPQAANYRERAMSLQAPPRSLGDGNRKAFFGEVGYDSEFDEEVDEDFSDIEDNDCTLAYKAHLGVLRNDQVTEDAAAATGRLLSFLELVNSDIQKYFGRNKDAEDACDIYEDKWTSGKSGRELYYADLMKIAQGIDGDEPKSPPKLSSESSTQKEVNGSKKDAKGEEYSGRLEPGLGLGPLEALFEEGLKSDVALGENRHASKGKGKRSSREHPTDNVSKRVKALPMTERNLPQSFWKEPKFMLKNADNEKPRSDHCNINNNNSSSSNFNTKKSSGLVNTTKDTQRKSNGHGTGTEILSQPNMPPPDFGDLLDCWGDVTPMTSSSTSSVGGVQLTAHSSMPHRHSGTLTNKTRVAT